jgi:tetratricopeptide (TPR) repeat protein
MADRLDEAMTHLASALKVARASADKPSLADILYHLGTVAWSAGNNRQATIFHGEAVKICYELRLQDLRAVQALHGYAESLTAAGRPADATRLFEESLTLSRRIGHRRYEAENLQMIAWCALGVGGLSDYQRAQAAGELSLAISQEAHLDWNSWSTMCFLGLASGCLGEYRRGLALLQEGAEQLKAAGLVRFLTMAYGLLGYLYQDLNLHTEALAAHTLGLETGLNANVGFWLPRLCADVAIDRLRLGDLEVVRDLEEALSIAEEGNQQMHSVRCLEGLAEACVARGEGERALDYTDQLLALATAGRMREMAAQAHHWRGAALIQLGQYAEAEAVLGLAAALAQECERIRLQWDVHAVQARLYHAWGRPERAAHHEQSAAALVRQIAENLQDPALMQGLPLDSLLNVA